MLAKTYHNIKIIACYGVGNGLVWPTRLALPKKEFLPSKTYPPSSPKKLLFKRKKCFTPVWNNQWTGPPQNFLYLPKITNFPNENFFCTHLKEPLTYYTQLAHLKKKFLPKKFLHLPEKTKKKKKKSRPPERANFLPNKSFFYTYLKKK